MHVARLFTKFFVMNFREVPIISMMKDVNFKLAAYPKEYTMNIIVIDIPPQYGMLLSRKWFAAISGNIWMDSSYVMIPMNGRNVRLDRETETQI